MSRIESENYSKERPNYDLRRVEQNAQGNIWRIEDYLKERHINKETAKLFNLGYLDKKANSKFAGRLTIPIKNEEGDTVAFVGRTLENEIPKYINSKGSDIYKKREILFGLHLAKKHIKEVGFVIICEGYLDMISLYQSGVKNVVAVGSASLGNEQVQILQKYSNNLLLIFDGDSSGIKATLRSIDRSLEEGANMKIIILPDNHDPDSYINENGKEKLLAFLKNAKEGIAYKYQFLINQDKYLGDIIEEIFKMLSKTKLEQIKLLYCEKLAKFLNIEREVLYQELKALEV